jgi:hemolysin III
MLSWAEELTNTLTHGIGLLLSLPAAALLVATVSRVDDQWRATGCVVYAICLVGVYAASTLSHCVASPRWRHRFRTVDQALIYLLIVATYTPLSIVYLRTPVWWIFLGLMWLAALAGFLSKLVFSHRVHAVSLWGYVLLGWVPVVAGPALLPLAPATLLWWMLVGGLCYTAGILFLLLDRHIPHFHALWHVCVVAGSAWHFVAIYTYAAQT